MQLISLALGIFSIEDIDAAGLVPETERSSFSEGLARYYSHVVGLFEKARSFAYVADFAQLGLRSLIGREDEQLKTELLQRFFTACVQTSRFREAYSAIASLSDAALSVQSSYLKRMRLTNLIGNARTSNLS